MKKFSIIIPIFIFFILGVTNSYATPDPTVRDSECLTMNNVSINVVGGDWSGGPATVSCAGVKNGQHYTSETGEEIDSLGYCPGDSEEIYPDEPTQLRGCNCNLGPSGKCLQVSNLPANCHVISPQQCGVNKSSIDAEVTVQCEDTENDNPLPPPNNPNNPPQNPPPGNLPPAQKQNCNANISCNGVCSSANQCGPGFKDQCVYTTYNGSDQCNRVAAPNQACASNCANGMICNSNNQCVPPPAAGTPKYLCRNNSCERDDTNGTSTDSNCNNSCQIVPPPPVPPVPPNNPNSSPNPPGSSPNPPGSSPQPPIPFSTAMCKCDGITTTPIAAGQTVTVNAFGKVEGADINSANLPNMTFYLAQDDVVIAKSDPVATSVVTSNANLKRYKSVWSYKLPSAVNPNSLYRIWAQPNCQKNNVAYFSPLSGPNLSFLDNLFGLFPDNSNTKVNIVSTAYAQSQDEQIKLKTLSFGKVIENSCRFVMFKFPQQ